MRRLTIAASAMAALLVATPAVGDVIVQDGGWADRPFVEVRYSDLDLDSQGGLATLNRRLAAAAITVCGADEIRQLRVHVAVRNCRSDSMERAFADRDAVIAARMAARDDPTRLAAMELPALRVRR
ncbi:UrcA family protein [Novosphingobium album (ex Hu et al. 2023)]|uniref:UrcA family protein n=1 Tax=Novosphingobium album (ex Hu et al. 2023) TaxID=2930093 RepID=A0ABT0B239_9SPHN|nr:UrcA family protein [Novosphingobium album (ex Hu et al. 2023)]MCJ2178874.1 UrcA family protein [Novosphingobium album (ex Hu et al. 2023)]